MYLKYYLNLLDFSELPDFILKYLKVPSLLRLKNIDYFCGMKYASKDIYDFKECISRYDHSLTVSLLIYKLTKNKEATLAGLFHDISTPCFSHVIDYMNNDYERQESTEEFTGEILKHDKYLMACLKEDKIDINNIINFKKYSVVDNDRPKVCADRLDGVILTGIAWTKNIEKEDILEIIKDIKIFKNEFGEYEIGFKTLKIAERVLQISETIDYYCHTKEDNYMMDLLAKITKLAINNNYITYENLYTYDEKKLWNIFKKQTNEEFQNLINEFETIKKDDIKNIKLPKVKIRDLNPLVNGIRMK